MSNATRMKKKENNLNHNKPFAAISIKYNGSDSILFSDFYPLYHFKLIRFFFYLFSIICLAIFCQFCTNILFEFCRVMKRKILMNKVV